MRKLSLLIVLAVASIAFAQSTPVGFTSFTDDGATAGAISFNGTLVPVGSLIQVIKPGANGVLDAPEAMNAASYGSLTGDDLPVGMFYMGDMDAGPGDYYTYLGVYSSGGAAAELNNGNQFYIRCWVREGGVVSSLPVPAGSYYADGGPFTATNTVEWIFGGGLNPNNTNPLWTVVPAHVPAPEINVTVPATPILFGSVDVGMTSAAQTITIQNTGDADLVLSDVMVTGDFAGAPMMLTIAGGASTTWDITFAPTAEGICNGVASFSCNDADEGTFSVNLEGTGLATDPYVNGGVVPVTGPGGTDPANFNFPNDPNTNNNPPFGASFGPNMGGTNPTQMTVAYNTTPSVAGVDFGLFADLYVPGTNSANRFWNVTQTGGVNFNATLDFFVTTDEMPNAWLPNPAAAWPVIMMNRFDAGFHTGNYLPEWTDMGGGLWRARIYDVNGFSGWGMGQGGILPVEGLEVVANGGNNVVNLHWSVQTETNNAYFRVERSDDNGATWFTAARINSRANGGNSSSPMNYYFDDARNVVNESTYQYRIVDVATDGRESRSNIVVSATPRAPVVTEYALANYPNPFNPETRIAFTLKEAGFVRLTVTNIMGQTIATLVNNNVSTNGTHYVTWNANNMPSGIYFLRMEVNGFSSMRKLVLSK